MRLDKEFEDDMERELTKLMDEEELEMNGELYEATEAAHGASNGFYTFV